MVKKNTTSKYWCDMPGENLNIEIEAAKQIVHVKIRNQH